jgi:Ala-tRNA(Pro) deacylase
MRPPAQAAEGLARRFAATKSETYDKMRLTRDQLFARLAELGIETQTVEHPPAFTVADSSSIEIPLPGAYTKNLFLKDEEGTLVLVIAKSTTPVDLKVLSKRLGAGRFSFGKPELLMSVLGVTPGSVTAFAVVNDAARRVKVVFDQALMAGDSVNCHPLENTATTNIARDDLLRFIRTTGHEPRVMVLTAA